MASTVTLQTLPLLRLSSELASFAAAAEYPELLRDVLRVEPERRSDQIVHRLLLAPACHDDVVDGTATAASVLAARHGEGTAELFEKLLEQTERCGLMRETLRPDFFIAHSLAATTKSAAVDWCAMFRRPDSNAHDSGAHQQQQPRWATQFAQSIDDLVEGSKRLRLGLALGDKDLFGPPGFAPGVLAAHARPRQPHQDDAAVLDDPLLDPATRAAFWQLPTLPAETPGSDVTAPAAGRKPTRLAVPDRAARRRKREALFPSASPTGATLPTAPAVPTPMDLQSVQQPSAVRMTGHVNQSDATTSGDHRTMMQAADAINAVAEAKRRAGMASLLAPHPKQHADTIGDYHHHPNQPVPSSSVVCAGAAADASEPARSWQLPVAPPPLPTDNATLGSGADMVRFVKGRLTFVPKRRPRASAEENSSAPDGGSTEQPSTRSNNPAAKGAPSDGQPNATSGDGSTSSATQRLEEALAQLPLAVRTAAVVGLMRRE